MAGWLRLGWDVLFDERFVACNFADEFRDGVAESIVAVCSVRSETTCQGMQKLSIDGFVACTGVGVTLALR